MSAATASLDRGNGHRSTASPLDDEDENEHVKSRLLQGMTDQNKSTGQGMVYQSPGNIDQFLSKGLLELNIKDRNEVDEEIHGVSSCAVPETPAMLEQSLRDLSRELHHGRILQSHPNLLRAYRESQVLPETYVNSADFRLRFLRTELFDAPKAALRMLRFLDFASQMFGPVVLQRPMRISDFTREERKFLQAGNYQMLPYRDQKGRPIYTCVGDFGFRQINARSRWRVVTYLHWTISDDAESQRQGFVNLVWAPSNVVISPKWEDFEYTQRLDEAMPMRFCAVHWCVPRHHQHHGLPMLHPLNVFRCGHELSMGRIKHRMKFHFGDKVEILYKLKTYGIPVEWLPVTETGNLKTLFWKHWTRYRLHLEELRACGSPEAKAMAICPRSKDVLFRGGTSVRCHPGNARFENLIEAQLASHVHANQTEKTAITRAIIRLILESGGRFLIWNTARNWWRRIDDPSVIHHKVAEKVRFLTGKRHTKAQQQQGAVSLQSSTSAFCNQDHHSAKRRRTDDSDGSNERCCLP